MNLAEIKNLPMLEKFRIMEALWEDMREEVEEADLPEEHKRILDSCHERAATGEEKFFSLDEAQHLIGHK